MSEPCPNCQLGTDHNWTICRLESELAEAKRELVTVRKENEEQARLLGISGSREARLLALAEGLAEVMERMPGPCGCRRGENCDFHKALKAWEEFKKK